MKKHLSISADLNFDFLTQAYQSLMAYSHSSLFGMLLLAAAIV